MENIITVKSVRRIKLDNPVPVYDATSPKYHNFALANGVVVHNTAKIARHREFQATLALKGKPLNVAETAKSKVTANKEIASIFAGIGLDLNAKNPVEKLRFGKLIYLTDPDVDGKHINTLLHALFWTYLPDLYREGRIYLLRSPEYMARHKGKVFFGPTVKDVQKQAGSDKINIRHIKGWGELDAEDMQPIAFDIGQRQLIRVLPPADKKGVQRFKALMGKNSAYRQKLLGVVA